MVCPKLVDPKQGAQRQEGQGLGRRYAVPANPGSPNQEGQPAVIPHKSRGPKGPLGHN